MYANTRLMGPVLTPIFILMLLIAMIVSFVLVPVPSEAVTTDRAGLRMRPTEPLIRWACGLAKHEAVFASEAADLKAYLRSALHHSVRLSNVMRMFLSVFLLPLIALPVLALPTRQVSVQVGLLALAAIATYTLVYRLLMRTLIAPELRARLREAGCNTCVRCGYDLSGHGETNVICPECGLRHPEPPGEMIRDSSWYAETDEATNDRNDSKRSPSSRG